MYVMLKHASTSATKCCAFFPLPCLPLPFAFEAADVAGDSSGGSSSSLMTGVSGTCGSQKVNLYRCVKLYNSCNQ